MRSLMLVTLLLGLLAATATAVPTTMSYQGQLVVDGTPYDGSASFKFTIVDGDKTLWSNDGTSVSGSEPTAFVNLGVDRGMFSVYLGDSGLSMVPLTADLLVGSASPALRIWVDTGSGFEQLSDQPLSSSPFSLIAREAQVADSVRAGGIPDDADWEQASGNVYRMNGNVGIGTANPNYTLSVVGYGTDDQVVDIKDGNLRIQNQNPRVFISDNLGSGYVGTDNSGTILVAPLGQVHFLVGPEETKVSNANFAVQNQNPRIHIGDNAGWSSIGTDNNGNILVVPLAGRLEVQGTTRTNVLEITGADLVEPFDASGSALSPGFVVAIADDGSGTIRACGTPYDRKVIGVVSGAGGLPAGIEMGRGSILDGDTLVALTGRVYVLCTTSNGAVQPGDLLTSSPTSGHAMKVTDYSAAQGATIGKAMTPLAEGSGLVLVLVGLQ